MLAPVAHVPLSDFLAAAHPGGAAPTPITLPAATPTRDAIHTLVSHRVWGVPVVDDCGAVVANFSVSDVRHLARAGEGAESALARPVLAFLQGRHAATTGGPGDSLSPVVVHGTDTVSMAIQLLAEGHLHRIFVVDGARRPVAVLTLTDVMRVLTRCMDA